MRDVARVVETRAVEVIRDTCTRPSMPAAAVGHQNSIPLQRFTWPLSTAPTSRKALFLVLVSRWQELARRLIHILGGNSTLLPSFT